MPLPTLDEEFPADTLYESDGGAVLPATSLHDRFYRRYGRMPTDTDAYVLNMRQQYERNVGRPPNKTELLAIARQAYESREDVPV